MSEKTAQTVRSINDANIAFMRGEGARVPFRKHIRALTDPVLRGEERRTPDFHEAMIGACVIGRAFPNRARGHLKRLEEICTEVGNPKRFQVFQAMVNAYLAPERLSGHGYQSDSLADLDLLNVAKGLQDVTAPLRDLGYEYFVNSGSLLGLTREGGLIEHDDDIDLAVVLKAKSEKKAITEWQKLRDQLSELGAVDESARKTVVCKLNKVSGVMVDLFPLWVQSGKIYVYPYSYGDLKKKDLLPLGSCERTGLPVPADPEAFLEQNYGPGWREPDPYFRFPWQEAKQKFRTFLEGSENA